MPLPCSAARMTLAIPASSADTLLDDWLAGVAASQREEVALLRDALHGARADAAGVRRSMGLEASRFGAELAKDISNRLDVFSTRGSSPVRGPRLSPDGATYSAVGAAGGTWPI